MTALLSIRVLLAASAPYLRHCLAAMYIAALQDEGPMRPIADDAPWCVPMPVARPSL